MTGSNDTFMLSCPSCSAPVQLSDGRLDHAPTCAFRLPAVNPHVPPITSTTDSTDD